MTLHTIRSTIKPLFTLSLIVFVVFLIPNYWHSLIQNVSTFNPSVLFQAALLYCIYNSISGEVWFLITRWQVNPKQKKLNRLELYYVHMITALARYLPGGIWDQVSKIAYLRTTLRLSSKDISINILAQFSVLVTTALGLVIIVLPNAIQYLPLDIGIIIKVLITGVMLTVTIGMVLFLYLPRTLRKLQQYLLDLIKVPIAPYIWQIFGWIVYGSSFYLTLVASGATNNISIFFAVGSIVIAWLIGFLTIFSPSGAGVREVILIGLLASFLSIEVIISLAVVFRFVGLLADLITFGTTKSILVIKKRIGK